jgi:hypothetical protein
VELGLIGKRRRKNGKVVVVPECSERKAEYKGGPRLIVIIKSIKLPFSP